MKIVRDNRPISKKRIRRDGLKAGYLLRKIYSMTKFCSVKQKKRILPYNIDKEEAHDKCNKHLVRKQGLFIIKARVCERVPVFVASTSRFTFVH